MEHFYQIVSPDLIKYYLLGAIGIFIFITVILFVVLIVHKLHVERRQKRLKRLQDTYADFLVRKQSQPDLVIEKPDKDIEFEALGNAIIDMTSVKPDDGAFVSHLRRMTRVLELDVYNRKLASSRSWVERYRAVETLGFLKMPEFGPFYHSILKKEKNIHVITKTIWSLSLIAEENDLDAINSFLSDPLFASSKFKEYIYTNIIRTFQERGEENRFVQLLESWVEKPDMPVLLKKDAISACGVVHLTSAKDVINKYYTRFHEVTEMKIACIRALERLGAHDMCHLIVSALNDEDWRVRAVAAKNAEVCSDIVIGALESVLRDRNYYVRINAAQALSKLGQQGIAVLSRFTSSDDKFARDMAHYMLNR